MGLTESDAKGILELLKTRIVENRERLIELDAALGDSDLGLTMSAGFTAAAEATATLEAMTPGEIFSKAGLTIATTAPSTMGTLLATGFMKGGKAVRDKETLELGDLAAMFSAFTEAIAARGKAKLGEKTVLDVLVPVTEALRLSADAGEPLPAALAKATEAAEAGLVATRDMVAVHGRPAYYGEQSRGRQDPGATVGRLIVQAFSDYLTSRSYS
jgi:dihydroxyacetone kinase-like protein